MRRLIFLTAAAAVIVPGAAVAQHHGSQGHHEQGHHGEGHHGQHPDNHNRNDRHHNQGNHHNRSHYVPPHRNWSYRPVSVGHRLEPTFYGSRYYINDYGSYHLRAPGRYQRWIRYGDDLLLINVRTGRVLDVIHYRYW